MTQATGHPGERVFLSGGSGFVGNAVLRELLGRGMRVSALVHDSPVKAESDLVDSIRGGLFDADALRRAMEGCDAAIHLVGVIMERPSAGVTYERMHVEGTRRVLEAAREAGVKRLVHMSALGSRPGAVSRYHQTKWEAEELVRSAGDEWGLRWTIFRPSIIHGPGSEFLEQAVGWARRRAMPFLFMPYFGAGVLGLGGAGKLQPIYVGDVARAFVDAIGNERAVGRVYNLAGPEVITWPQLHRAIARAVVGRERLVVPIPAWYAGAIARVTPAALLPFNHDQVIMSQEDNAGDTSEFLADFDIQPAPFEPTLRSYAHQL